MERFSCLARQLSSPEPRSLDAAEGWAKGQSPIFGGPKGPTGWYYRDVLESAAYGKLIRFQGEVRVRTPTCDLTRLTDFQLLANTFNYVPMTAEVWDNNVFWSATVNPTRMTMRSAGLYLIMATVMLNTTNAGFFAGELYVNNTTFIGGNRIPKNNQGTYLNVVGMYYFHANDYVELRVFNSANTTQFRVPTFSCVAITPEALIV